MALLSGHHLSINSGWSTRTTLKSAEHPLRREQILSLRRQRRFAADVKTKDQTERPKDAYAELIKLDDLRKRGILTEAEFEAQKKKLLEGR